MVRLGLWTDAHGQENVEAIRRVFDLEGILGEHRISLGDNVYATLTGYTANQSRTAALLRKQILMRTELRKTIIEKGVYTDEQLKRIVAEPYKLGEETADKVATAEYKDLESRFPKAQWLPGNWDRKVAREVLGEKLLENRTLDLDGLKILGLPGGGPQPTPHTFFDKGLFADHPDDEQKQYVQWVPQIDQQVESGEVNVICSHDKIYQPNDASGDQIKELLQNHLLKAMVARDNNENIPDEKKKPVTCYWGHNHCPTSVDFVKFDNGKKILSVTPGTAGINHYAGSSHSSVITSEFDEVTKDLKEVKEFRIYTFHDGKQDVEHYATHKIDWDKEKVNLEKVEKVLFTRDLGPVKNNLNLDKNYELRGKGFIPKYEGLTTEQKNTRLQMNIALADEYSEETALKLTQALTSARRKLICGRDAKGKISYEELTQAISKVRRYFAEQAAKDIGVNFRTSDDATKELYQNIMLKTAYGVSGSQLDDGLYTDNLKVSNIGENWGKELVKEIQEQSNGYHQSHALQGLEAEELQEMAELALPLNYERTSTYNKSEKRDATQFWAKSWQQGLLTGEYLDETGMYKKIEAYTPNKKTKAQLEEMLGAPTVEEEPSEEDIERAQNLRQQQAQQQLANLFRQANPDIDPAAIPQIQLADHLPGQNGLPPRLDDLARPGLGAPISPLPGIDLGPTPTYNV